MRTVIPSLLLTLAVLLSAGCGSTRFMTPASPRLTTPPAGKVLVNFHRPSNWGGGQDYPLFDSLVLIGNLRGGSEFQYVCAPGSHLFIGKADHVSVVQGILAADGVYDLLVDVTPGAWQENIFLSPVTKNDVRRSQLPDFERRERLMALTDQGDAAAFQAERRDDLELIIHDFAGGAKSDRLRHLMQEDAR